MITKEEKTKIDILYKQIENLESSDSSAITPISVCEDLITQKFDISLSYFDICCGKGTLLLCLYLKFWETLDIVDTEEKNRYIFNMIAGNDISKAQVEITKSTLRKVQKILKIKTILEFNIYNYDINDKNNLNELKRKFSVVITNPPYNSERNENNSSRDIYPEFIEKAFELSQRYVIMITKSNWMTKPTKKKFREKMINEFNVDKIVHYKENPFIGTDIQGGVSYFVIDNENTKDTFELNGVVYDRKEALDFLPYELNGDELKVLNLFKTFDKIDLNNFRSPSYYNIGTNDNRLTDNGIKCNVSEQKGKVKYLPNEYINNKIEEDYNKYKIFTSAAYGSPYSMGRVFKGHQEICSASLVNWVFESEKERDLFYDYINTKIFRFSVSLIKNKKHVYKNVFNLVPNINLNELEKVNDENIYKYLNLTEDDIKTIEDRCERLKLLK